MGRPFTGLLRSCGLPHAHLAKDLVITERGADTYLAEKAALALTGFLVPSAVQCLLVAAGRPLPWPLPVGVSLTLAVCGFLAPDAAVRADAAQRRSAFRHALSAYLNLIHILLAGGSGVDGALTDAATIGRGWAFAHLRRALATARITRTSPWEALGQLGADLGVNELTELAAALSLAGTEGARVRASLAAKASALQTKSAGEAEAKANAATERMALPGVVMASGFILFVFYPALTQITDSF
ncbi:type II secretion system F family protein [Streptomyces sp. NPDC059009]|uniref:type II secretion system F family protein n=1 Tax=Streptomyces sp. NPDC059009 TaxID=3346694 RepID=UPI00369630DE